MKWWMLLFCLLSAPLSAQRWMHGVLLGGGVGFTHSLEVNPTINWVCIAIIIPNLSRR